MKKKIEEWLRFRRLLPDNALELLESARALSPPPRTHRLKNAVDDLASFAETTIDLVLEYHEWDPEHGHRLGDRAQELFASGALEQDYSRCLDRLILYRNHAMYGASSNSPSSTYELDDVLECWKAMVSLRQEVEGLLGHAD